MGNKLFIKVLIFYPVAVCLLLFLPAGSFQYWQAWIYSMAILIPLLTTLLYLAKYDPALLKRRMRTIEKEDKQKKIIRLFRLPYILGYLIPGLDYRFHWSEVPLALVVISNIIVLLGYFWVFLVFRENTYTSRIVEVEKGQTVITTGPYSFIRHPMYLGTSVMFVFTPLALGSWWALPIFMFLPVVLIIRMLDEERLLKKELPGYKEYCLKTRYRLIPYIW